MSTLTPRDSKQGGPLGIVGGALLAAGVHVLAKSARWLSRRYVTPPLATEQSQVHTADGYSLSLRRLRPPQPSRHPPVLMLAGLGGTGDAFLMPQRSLAAYLASQGFDCFVVDLRGRRRSLPIRSSGARAENDELRFDWGLTEYLEQDLPALITAILQQTGAPGLSWLGHSMGGMLAYAYQIQNQDPRVKSVITLGSALDYTRGQSAFQDLARRRALLSLLPFVPIGSLSRLTAAFLSVLPASLARFSFHPDNLERALARRYLTSTFCEASPRELLDLCSVVEPGGLRDPRSQLPYEARAARFVTPVLAVAGDDDRQCSAADVQHTLAKLGSADRRFVLAELALGSPAPFGHEDMLVGRHAPAVLWPALAAWLAEHS